MLGPHLVQLKIYALCIVFRKVTKCKHWIGSLFQSFKGWSIHVFSTFPYFYFTFTIHAVDIAWPERSFSSFLYLIYFLPHVLAYTVLMLFRDPTISSWEQFWRNSPIKCNHFMGLYLKETVPIYISTLVHREESFYWTDMTLITPTWELYYK